MKLLVDSANVKQIEQLKTIYPISGVTTNPSILAKEATASETSLAEINHLLEEKDEFHVQVLSEDADSIKREAFELVEAHGKNIFVKIPVSDEGYKAIKDLSREGIKITATAVFTFHQGILAGLAGVQYIAPYINRIDNHHGDGIELIRKLSALYEREALGTQILAASFKNTKQIEEALIAGASTVTIPGDLFEDIGRHEGTSEAIKGFTEDYYQAFK